MRDYELNVTQSRQAYGQVTWLVRIVQNWRMRKTLKQMLHFSDHQLRDIGLMRAELHRLIALPLDSDHAIEAERSLLVSAQSFKNVKTVLALPSSGGATFYHSEQPARNLSGIVQICLPKKLDQITLFSAQHC